MTEDNRCPAPEQLWKLSIGELPIDASVVLNEHLAGCLACQTTTATLATSDALLNLVRQAGRQTMEMLPEDMERVMTALRDRNRTAALVVEQSETLLSAVDDSAVGPNPQSTTIDDELIELLARLRPAEAPSELGRLADFRLLKVLGYGGMGAVFLAEDTRLQRPVALKLVRAGVLGRHNGEGRFLREARAAANVRHENVVTIYQVGEENGVPFLVQELLEGETLEALLADEGRFSVTKALNIGKQIALGLAAAHARGLVHRDIKPANVFLARNVHPPDTFEPVASEIVKLLDFGLARPVSDSSDLTQSGKVIGTPAFMSPEQAGGEPVDHRTDLFSLGCVLYVMLTGQRPFRGGNIMKVLSSLASETPPTVKTLRPEVPSEVSQLVEQLLSMSADGRPGTASDVAARLAALISSQASPVDSRQTAPAGNSMKQSVNGLFAMIGALAVFVIVGAIAITIANNNETQSKFKVSQTSTIPMTNEPPGTIDPASTGAVGSTDGAAGDGVTASNVIRKNPDISKLDDHALPYVILRDGKVVGEFPYLPLQAPVYRGGDVIEVRGNGPFHLPQIVADREFHLRAAEGYQPVFVAADSVSPDQHWIMVFKGALRLEGCEFRRMRYCEHDMIGALGDSCDIVNCTLAQGASNYGSLVECRCPNVGIKDSLLISGAGHVACKIHSEVRELSVENSLFLCGSFTVFAIDQCDVSRSFRLVNNTIAGTHFLLGGEFVKVVDRAFGEPIRIVARHNLFPREFTIVAADPNAQFTIDDFRSRLAWQGEENVGPNIADQSFVEDLAGPGQGGLISDPKSQVQCNRAWSPHVTATERVEAIRKSVTVGLPDETDKFDLNWETIGPGVGYLRTLDPGERDHQQPEAILEGGPFTLVHADSPARGFTNLVDAVRASQDGDSIELRTNDALTASLDISIPGRRLTIRAARGYQPQFIDTSGIRLGVGHDWEFVNLTFRGSLGYYSDGQIRRLQNCAFDVGDVRVAESELGLQLPGRRSPGPDMEIVNCVLPGITKIDAGPDRNLVIRNSVLQACQLGSAWSPDGDIHVRMEDCVVWNPTQMTMLFPFGGQPKGRAVISAEHCLFDGYAMLFGPQDRIVWSGDRNQFRLWHNLWSQELPPDHDPTDLASWQKRWGSDVKSTSAPSIYFDPQQWHLLAPQGTEPRATGVDFTRFHRPPALR